MKRFVAALIAVATVAGCSARAPELIGVWKYQPISARQPYFLIPGPMPGENETRPLRSTKPDPQVAELNARLGNSSLTLYPNHTFMMTVEKEFSGTWKLSGQNLLLKPSPEADREPIAFNVSDDNRKLTSVPQRMGEILVTYEKIK